MGCDRFWRIKISVFLGRGLLAKALSIFCLFRVEQLYKYFSYSDPVKIMILIRNRMQTGFPQ